MNSGNVTSYSVNFDIEITVDPNAVTNGVVILPMPEGTPYEGGHLLFLLSQRGIYLNKNKLNTFEVTGEVVELMVRKGKKDIPVTYAQVRRALLMSARMKGKNMTEKKTVTMEDKDFKLLLNQVNEEDNKDMPEEFEDADEIVEVINAGE